MPSSSKIQQDFDRIADLSEPDEWSHNSHYHRFLLSHLPAKSEADALDIGCGDGAFSRLLAQRYQRVIALDLSPRMIERAKERSLLYSNIDFQVADALTYEFPAGQFACIASIATLHHIPFEPMLQKIKNALKPGGIFLTLDLYKAESFGDYATSLLAFPMNIALKVIKKGRVTESPEIRAAWEEHGRTDVYPTLSQVRRDWTRILPNAQVKRHVLWRYSFLWRKEH